MLPLLEGDLFAILQSVTGHTLADMPVRVKPGASCCVVLASGGYPQAYQTGREIFGLADAAALCTPDGAFLRLWPHRHGTDGFFAAVWQRR